MIINLNEYRNKVLGCWMGKNIGGTLGAPFEWKRQVNNVTSYTQDLKGDPLPNDDLDIQLLWLIALEEKGIEVDARLLGEYWMLYVTPHWAEYGFAKINMKSSLMPPLSGIENNDYKDSCGAFIRSEIWACIAPGCPERAVKYAYEDAIIDHGNGEGVYAEIFCAALESAAFVEKDIYKLINIGLSYIPNDCATAGAIKNAIESYKLGKTWLEARDEVLLKYRGKFSYGNISEDDKEKGFSDGKQGFDVPSNIGMIIIGLIYGHGDFDETICTAVNCGEDTDCTGATIGSIFGIMNGIDAIPSKWKEPIGKSIKTACLNLGELGYFGNQLPADIDNLTRRVEKITKQVVLRYNLQVELSDSKRTDLSDLKDNMLFADTENTNIYKNINGPIYSFDFFDIWVDYCNGVYIKDNTPKKIKLVIENKYKIPAMVNVHFYAPSGWNVAPSVQSKFFISQTYFGYGKKEIEFELEALKVEGTNRFAVEFTIDGRHTVMLVPIILLGRNL